MNLNIVNPFLIQKWDDFVLCHPEGTIYHSSAWARVLHESYGYEPVYFVSLRDGAIETLIPVMAVRSFLTGRRGVSLPFTDYCRTIVPAASDFHEAFAPVVEHATRSRWKSIEVRSDAQLPQGVPPSATFLRHTLDLTLGETELHLRLRDSTRRNIKKASKGGVTVTRETGLEALKQFYRLHCLTRKHHGLPPQPWRFFEKCHQHLIAKGLGAVFHAMVDGNVVASAVFLNFGSRAVYKYGASDRRQQQMRANNLVMWEAIRWFVSHGFSNLCFGRSDPENTGLIQFKRGWATAEERVSYCHYSVSYRRFTHGKPSNMAFLKKIFQCMPGPLLRMAGRVLYRHAA